MRIHTLMLQGMKRAVYGNGEATTAEFRAALEAAEIKIPDTLTISAAREKINKTGAPLFQELRDKYMKLDLPALRYEPACFAAGTLVHTKEGLKPIETIQVGDLVLSKHESGEGERAYKRVTRTFVHEDRQVIRVGFGGRQADGTDKWNCLIVTPEHPIWVQGKGWKPAEKLKYYFPFINLELLADESPKIYGNTRLFVTDKPDIAWVPSTNVSSDLGRVGCHINVHTLETVATGVFVGIESVENTHRVKSEHLFRTTVYNIEVEDFHTYYVGKAGVWVHNKNIRTAITAPDGKPLPNA